MKKVQNHKLIYLPLSDLQYGDFHQSTMEEMQNSTIFHTFFILWSIFVRTNLREGESMYYFIYFLYSLFNYLIGGKIIKVEWHYGQ